MAHLITVHEYPKGKEFLLNSDHIESASVVESPSGTRSAVRIVGGEKTYHLQESLDDLTRLCLPR
jgi:hypothetical protein